MTSENRRFAKLLVTNRGEIACRVMATASKLGIGTVSVYSDADARARHVEMADESVWIGAAAPAESYLRGDRIIEAALATGAGAIHPGYGFLSENPDFVEAVEAAGLIFVGPSAEAIRAMGLKDAAKALMEEAGVPVVTGYHGAGQAPDRLREEAARIGYPVLIKAVAGGGGKGMRRVARPDDFVEALSGAQAEARTAFGNDAVLIEKFVEKPRHIEVQVFGDGTKAVHLFERDCSLQRRHQKVIEEAPAPGMSEEMRAAMGEAGVRAAEAVGYKGAGTVEFIVDASDGLRPDRFWFMEMNTRLQVEHPVTEAITGVDLVEWQLRVAAGEPLPMAQDQISIRGHAIEARLYAEDADAGFLPATGRLEHLVFPGRARIDSGVRQGDTITPHYDPIIAKVTVHGADRSAALASMARALDGTQVAGTVTNRGFLRRLIDHPNFVSADLDTGIIDRDLEALTRQDDLSDEVLALAAVAALDLSQDRMSGFSLWTLLRHQVTLGDNRVEVWPTSGGASVRVGERELVLTLEDDGWRVDGRKTALEPVRLSSSVAVFGPGGAEFQLSDPVDTGAGGEAAGAVEAPMPGKVTAVLVAAGEAIEKGQRLAVLEAMKMEHALTAPRDGIIAEVLATEGDQVEAGAALVRLEEEAA